MGIHSLVQCHIIVNGDLRSLLLFGGFAVFSLASIPITDKRARKRLGERWAVLAHQTSNVPFATLLLGRVPAADKVMALSLAVTVSLVYWLLFAKGHAMLFGVDPIAIFGYPQPSLFGVEACS